MRSKNTHIVQLPFPSLRTPDEQVVSYYKTYSRLFSDLVKSYFIPDGSLWELPLWVAHLSGMLESIGYVPSFNDLSATLPAVDECSCELLARTQPDDVIL